MAYLALVRHGESEWNAKGLWTGWTDIPLTQAGKDEAKRAGKALKNIKFDIAFVSPLIRAKQTLDEIKKAINAPDLRTIVNPALNERNYGIYTGKNKWEIKKELGDEKFNLLRRAWNYPVPKGETLKNVYERVIPYYKKEILPRLLKNENVLISAHGNSLRALVKYLDNISDENIQKLELVTGEVYLYKIKKDGKVLKKKILS